MKKSAIRKFLRSCDPLRREARTSIVVTTISRGQRRFRLSWATRLLFHGWILRLSERAHTPIFRCTRLCEAGRSLWRLAGLRNSPGCGETSSVGHAWIRASRNYRCAPVRIPSAYFLRLKQHSCSEFLPSCLIIDQFLLNCTYRRSCPGRIRNTSANLRPRLGQVHPRYYLVCNWLSSNGS